ncbi:MAG: PDDEXK nuclease domain-containing protein [Gammaproteobacteria bacterium]|nr:PDDEXK nuclease domain-containing protein [Gammaproteobacteria bacterium]
MSISSLPKKSRTSKGLPTITHDPSYQQLLFEAKEKVRLAQLRASVTVNQHMLFFYWDLGQMMLQQQKAAKWGDKWIDQFSLDLSQAFPEQSGFSRTNLLYMRKFAETYPDIQIVQHVVGQLPWGQNIVLLSLSDPKERDWYTHKAIQEGWIRKELIQAIHNKLYHAQGIAEHKISNFGHRLPAPQSEQAHEILKDPYKFHFLSLGKEAEEKEIESGLIEHITHFLLELGQGVRHEVVHKSCFH